MSADDAGLYFPGLEDLKPTLGAGPVNLTITGARRPSERLPLPAPSAI